MKVIVNCAVAMACMTVIAPEPAAACMVLPPQMSLRDIVSQSAAIVSGTLSYRYDHDGRMRGVISVAQVIKGQRRASFAVLHSIDFDPACQPFGWSPPYSLTPRQVAGRFYLFGDADGYFSIARFARTEGR